MDSLPMKRSTLVITALRQCLYEIIMKKSLRPKSVVRTALFFLSAFIFPFMIQAQVMSTENMTIMASLNGTLLLNMENSAIEFEFNTFDDYNDGVGSRYGAYYSSGSIAATSNWELSYVASEPFLHSDGTTTMDLDNLGVTVDWTGSNKVKNYAKTHAVALSQTEVTLIGQQGNKSNKGDEWANSFVIYWQMGTGDGDMNSTSIMDQNLKRGTYSTTVEFIVSEAL